MKKSSSKLAIALLLLTTVGRAFAQSADQVPGMIPLFPGQAPAVDLLDEQGNEQLPEDLNAKHQQSNGSYDLSLLNPKTDSDIWSDKYPQGIDPSLDDLGIESGAEVTYVAPVQSRPQNFRFGGHLDQGGTQKLFTFQLTRLSTNILLRKALLRKLGYTVPPVKRLASLKVKFRTPGAKELFIDNILKNTNFDGHGRWIADEQKDNDSEITLQDVLVLQEQPQSYSLSTGFIPRGSIKDRRVLRSLIVPFELIYIPETVNEFPWQFGQIISNQLRMDYREATEFDGNFDDARWIGRRILKLSRQDFVDIASQTDTPIPVQKIIVEKLIARRNNMAVVLKLDSTPLGFDAQINDGQYLQNGKLIYQKEKVWEGYGQRFAFGDPESPLSNSDILSFIGSKGISNVIDNLLNQFNDKVIKLIDVTDGIKAHQLDLAKQQFVDYLKTGKVKSVPFGAYVLPTYGVNLIASRDIVIGSYLGTDNVVQLADSVGVSANVGAYIGFDGIPTPWHASGRAGGSMTRTYTHLRPLKSIKSAMSYPFKNILVPMLKHDYGNLLDDITQEKIDSIENDDDKKMALAKMMNVFKDQMQIGESLLITDTVGAELDLQAGYQFSDLLKAYGEFGVNQVVISRLHIHRYDDNTIHIYKDLGTVGSIELSATFEAAIPVLKIDAKFSNGQARTKFYAVNIDPVLESNPDLFKNVQALKDVFNYNSLGYLDSVQKPYVLHYNFDQEEDKLNFLFFRLAWLEQNTKIVIEKPDTTQKRSFFRKLVSKMSGVNYEELALDALNYGIKEATDAGVFVSNAATGRPSNSIYGSSLVRNVTVDGDTSQVNDGSNVRVENFFVKITYDWAGWEIAHDDAQKILDDINRRNNLQLYSPDALNDTKKIQFYDISLYYNIYDAGIKYMLSLNKEQLTAIFEKYKVKSLTHTAVVNRTRGPVIMRQSIVPQFMQVRQFFQDRYAQGNMDLYFGHLSNMVSIIESYLDKDGIMAMFGGEKNVLVGSRIAGFRTGDELGDQPYMSHTAGEFGSQQSEGPLEAMKDQLKMTDSEFYLYWLLERL